MNNVYKRHGYANRDEYLEGLADEYGVDLDVVYNLADVLGPNEDFDGLPMMLEDAAMCL
jgi:hypothetical protein